MLLAIASATIAANTLIRVPSKTVHQVVLNSITKAVLESDGDFHPWYPVRITDAECKSTEMLGIFNCEYRLKYRENRKRWFRIAADWKRVDDGKWVEITDTEAQRKLK